MVKDYAITHDSESDPIRYLNQLLQYVEGRLKPDEERELTKRIQGYRRSKRLKDTWLVTDYCFLSGIRADEILSPDKAEEYRTKLRKHGICPSPDLLLSYVLEDLDEYPKCQVYLEAHLTECNRCQSHVHDWQKPIASGTLADVFAIALGEKEGDIAELLLKKPAQGSGEK